jgi:hypothetical protein
MKRTRDRILVTSYFEKRKKQVIFNSWRNITSSIGKGRLRLRYTQMFNERSQAIQDSYTLEIERLRSVLEKLEVDIGKEMDERRNLAYLYDLSMNRGVEQFLKETNYIIDYNSSSKCLFYFLDVITPNERSIHHTTQ